jgi:hypothetical protein
MDATTLKAYRARWQAVEEIERQELQNATLDLRWRQLNAVIGLAIGLGIYQPVEDDIEVIQRWAKLKENAASQRPAT